VSEPILKLTNIESSYGPITAIRGISMSVPEGAIVTVLGANGAGKTTVLKTISGIIDPRKGAIFFEGKPIQSKDPDVVARMGIAHVPEGREVFPLLTARENLMIGAYARKGRKGVADDLEMVFTYLPAVKRLEKRTAGTLSGGEQQMLVIGRALMSRPRLLLLDEPSLGLSPRLVKEIFQLIVRVNQERKLSILVVEQNAGIALKTAHYGYVLELGRVMMEDSCQRLMEKEDVREFYLGATSTNIHADIRLKRRKTWQ
jgi:branched-chain amino acid transport system ATP-binding protein